MPWAVAMMVVVVVAYILLARGDKK
jgi:hypothetical protein